MIRIIEMSDAGQCFRVYILCVENHSWDHPKVRRVLVSGSQTPVTLYKLIQQLQQIERPLNAHKPMNVVAALPVENGLITTPF